MNDFGFFSSNLSSGKSDKIEYILYEQSQTLLMSEITKLFSAADYSPWIFSLIGSILVGLSGVFPLLIIRIEDETLGAISNRLRLLLSFAVGGLLGDVFLHLLPEAWKSQLNSGAYFKSSILSGVWVLIGLLIFIIIQKLCSSIIPDIVKNESKKRGKKQLRTGEKPNESTLVSNNNDQEKSKMAAVIKAKPYHISGYLNLMANFVDNFSHGMSIGGSFSISLKIGLLSTFAILIHELPHEIGDFAILLKSGFSRWEAAKAQLFTAFSGVLGSMMVVVCGSSDNLKAKTSWLLPFTAGGFLHIALVTVLPDLIKEESNCESWKQLGSLLLGIVVMAIMIILFG